MAYIDPKEDMRKAIVQERKMERIAAEGKFQDEKDIERWNILRQSPIRYYSTTVPTIPAPTGFVPTNPTYWQNPANIVYAYSQSVAQPNQSYEWTPYVSQAFAYLQQLPQNNGKDPTQWTWASETDPIMLGMSQYMAPPPELQYISPPPGASDQLYQYINSSTPPTSAVTQAQTANVLLPEWQQWYETFTGSPYAQAALQALPVFTISTIVGGALGSAPGALLAGGASIIAMGMMQSARNNDWFTDTFGQTIGGGINKLWDGFMRLNAAPAEWIEQGIGTIQQVAAGQVPNTWEGWNAAWDAARLTYESGGINRIANIFPAAEMVTDWLNWTDRETVPKLADYGEVLALGSPDPVALDAKYVGLSALNYARTEMLKGYKPPEQIVAEMRGMYGVSGEFSDLVVQSILDPTWSAIPYATKGLIRGIGKAAGLPLLVEATKMSHFTEGAIGTFRHWQELITNADVATLKPYEIKIGGFNPKTYVLNPVDPNYRVGGFLYKLGRFGTAVVDNPLSPVNWLMATRELTPGSKLWMMTDITARNIQEMWNRAEADITNKLPVEQRFRNELNRALHGYSEGDKIRYASMYNNAEWYTIRQWAGGLEGDVIKKLDNYASGKLNQDLLIRISELTKKSTEEVRDMLRNFGGEQDYMFKKLTEAIQQEGNIEGILDHPLFSPKGVADMLKWTDKNAHTPEQLKVELFDLMMDKMGDWSVKNYGIDKTPKYYRLMADMKAVGSFFLLGFNPRYFIKNVTDGTIGLMSQGVLGLRNVRTAIKIMEENRLVPARMTTGLGMGETMVRAKAASSGGYEAVERALSNLEAKLVEAERGGSDKAVGSAVTNLIKSMNKLAPFTKLSAKMESTQRATAYVIGFQKALPGMVDMAFRGIDKYPQLGDFLRGAGVDTRTFENSVRAAMLTGDFEAVNKAFSGVDPKVLRQPEFYVNDIARNTGLPLDKIMEVLNVDGTLDNLKQRLDLGQTIDEAIDGLRLDWEKALAKKQLADLEARSANLELKVRTGGLGEISEVLSDWTGSFFEQHGNNDVWWQNIMDRKAAATTKAEGWNIFRKGKNAVRSSWENFIKTKLAEFDGIMKGLQNDLSSPEVRDTISSATNYLENWREFFELRDRLWEDAIKKGAERGDPIWAEIREQLRGKYAEAATAELEYIDRLGNSMVAFFSKQYPDITTEPVNNFWNAVRDTAQRRQELMTDFRNALNGDPLDTIRDPNLRAMVQQAVEMGGEISSLWPTFWTRFYMPAIAEGIVRQGQAWTEHTHAIAYETPRAEGEVAEPTIRDPAQEAIDTMSAEKNAQALQAEHAVNTGEAQPVPEKIPQTIPPEHVNAVVKEGIAVNTKNAAIILGKFLKRGMDYRTVTPEQAVEAARIYRDLRNQGIKVEDAAAETMRRIGNEPIVDPIIKSKLNNGFPTPIEEASKALAEGTTPAPDDITPSPKVDGPQDIQGLIDSVARVSPEISPEQADALASLINGHARYLGMDADSYVRSRFAGFVNGGEPAGDALYKFVADDANIKAVEEYIKEAHFGEDYDSYVNETLSFIKKISNRYPGKNALRQNHKTLMSVDVSGNCPYRKINRACIYCYVENPRTYEGMLAEKGKRAAMNANLIYENGKYSGEILDMPQDLVNFYNDRMGGLRVFSIGDYQEADIATLDRVVADAREKGLKLKIITKQIDAVKRYLQYDNIYFNLSTDFMTESAHNIAKQAAAKMNALGYDQALINSSTKKLEAILSREDTRKLIGFGFPMAEAANIKQQSDRIKIRYVAVNKADAIRALADPRIDVVTMYHGMTSPENFFDIWKRQDPHLLDVLGPETTHALSSMFEAPKLTTITKGFDQNMIDSILGKGVATKEELITKSWEKMCCLTARCGTCSVCCGFRADQGAEILGKLLDGETRASVEFNLEGQALIRALSKVNIADISHEVAHIFRRDLLPDELRIASEWAGVDPLKWTVEAEEKFANGFEQYLREGKAPTPELRTIFEKFRLWLLDIYKSLTGQMDVKLDDNIRMVYDRLLGGDIVQTRLDGTPEPTAEALRGVPETGTYVKKLPRPLSYRSEIITGMAFHNGEFAAWVTMRFDQMRPADTALGDIQLLGTDLMGNWVFVDTDGTLVKRPMVADAEMLSTGPFAPHTAEALGMEPHPYLDMYVDGYHNQLMPILESLRNLMNTPHDVGGDLKGIGAEGQKLLNQYRADMQDGLSSARLNAIRTAESNGDMAILNYQRRTKADMFLSALLPYQFWYSRSALKWALYAVDRPGLLAFYTRLLRFMSEHSDEKTQYPTRLKGNIGMPLPWLPKWAGGSGYFDPINEFFPIHNFIRPYQMLEGMESRSESDAMYAILEMFNDGKITFQQAQEAMTLKQGTLWEQAINQAEMDSRTGNFIDYISLFQSPILPLNALWNTALGRDPVNQLPMSRFLQGLSGVTGWNFPAMLDIQAWWNKNRGVSEFGDWGNYYVDRQLSNMAAENPDPANVEAILIAMIERTGSLYEEAVQRVQYEQGLTSGMSGIAGITAFAKGEAGFGEMLQAIMFGWLPFKLLPEGEMLQRGLKDEWNTAVMEQREGNPDAIEAFFNAYPEYRARLALFDEPEERLRQFLVNEIWDAYWELSVPDRRAAVDQLGTQFDYAFINKSTRNYSGVDMSTLAGWANFLSRYVPKVVEPEQMPEFQQVPENVSALYTMYLTERDSITPNYSELNDEYFSLPNNQRKAFLAQHPELKVAWQLKDTFLESFPFMEEYMTSQEYKDRVQNAWVVIQDIGPAADYLRQFYYGVDMPSGVREYLYYYWSSHGRQKGDFMKWLYGMRYVFVP